MVADLSTLHKAFTTSLSSLETRLTEQRHADINQINQQIQVLVHKQQEMANQLPQGHLLDLIAQLVNFNQLPILMKKLNSNLQKLVEPKAKIAKTISFILEVSSQGHFANDRVMARHRLDG